MHVKKDTHIHTNKACHKLSPSFVCQRTNKPNVYKHQIDKGDKARDFARRH